MRIVISLVVALVVIGAGLRPVPADETMRLTRTVPADATVEYRVRGALVQSMALLPGTYEIVVRRLK